MLNWYNWIHFEWQLTVLVRWLIIWVKVTCKYIREGLKLIARSLASLTISYQFGRVGIPYTSLTLPLVCVCPKPRSRCSVPYVMVFYVFNGVCSFCKFWWNCWPSLLKLGMNSWARSKIETNGAVYQGLICTTSVKKIDELTV